MDENAVLNAEAEDITLFAQLVGIEENPVAGFLMLYVIVTVLNIIVFNLGFARKLSLVKNIIVYFVLILGSFILAFLAIGLPIAEGLAIAAVVLIVYKIRLHQSKKKEKSSSN